MDRQQTRKSLVAHFMPFGVMPTFFNASEVNAVPCSGGGYVFDCRWSATPKRQQTEATQSGKTRAIGLWSEWVPLTVRNRVLPSFVAWARKHVPH